MIEALLLGIKRLAVYKKTRNSGRGRLQQQVQSVVGTGASARASRSYRFEDNVEANDSTYWLVLVGGTTSASWR